MTNSLGMKLAQLPAGRFLMGSPMDEAGRQADEGPQRCIGVAKDKFCFERTSQMPEFIKYGSMAVGFGLLYAGRLQIKRRRNGG